MFDIISFLHNLTQNKSSQIREWLDNERKNCINSFIYNSIDIRYSGKKLTPIDTNIFPAGFNNLSKNAQIKAVEQFDLFFKQQKNSQKIIIISEFNTRNKFYLKNLNILKNIIIKTCRQVKIAFVNDEIKEKLELKDADENPIILYPLEKKDNKILINSNFIADIIVLNNDFTSANPEILANINQPVFPPVSMGWHQRSKHKHFLLYNEIARRFAKKFDFDPFFISTELGFCQNIDFKKKQGFECIAIAVEKTVKKLQEKYKKYGIQNKPYVFVKADQGTYGMGIMTASSAADIININKDNRKKMNIIKNNTQNTQILVQEGIETVEKYDNHTTEFFIYSVNGKPVGNIARINKEKDSLANLNSMGTFFLAADDIAEEKISAYNLIAELAFLAVNQETY